MLFGQLWISLYPRFSCIHWDPRIGVKIDKVFGGDHKSLRE